MKAFIAAVLVFVPLFLNAPPASAPEKPVLPPIPEEISALLDEMYKVKAPLLDEQFVPLFFGIIPAARIYSFWRSGDAAKSLVMHVLVSEKDGAYMFPSEFNEYSIIFIKAMTIDSAGRVSKKEWLNEALVSRLVEEIEKQLADQSNPKKGIDLSIIAKHVTPGFSDPSVFSPATAANVMQ